MLTPSDHRAILILCAELGYWEKASNQDFTIGATGALANVLHGIAMNLTPEEYKERVNERK